MSTNTLFSFRLVIEFVIDTVRRTRPSRFDLRSKLIDLSKLAAPITCAYFVEIEHAGNNLVSLIFGRGMRQMNDDWMMNNERQRTRIDD